MCIKLLPLENSSLSIYSLLASASASIHDVDDESFKLYLTLSAPKLAAEVS